jgi:hypothetical protein
MLRNLSLAISLFMLWSGTLKADFVNSQVTCSVGGQGTVTASNFCNVVGDPGASASASATASFTLPTSPGPLSVRADEQGFAQSYGVVPDPLRLSAAFSASNSIELTLDTPGPPRPGLFLITGRTMNAANSDTGLSESVFGFSTTFPDGVPLRLLPITLGVPFTFTYVQSMSCFDDANFFFAEAMWPRRNMISIFMNKME